MMQHDCTPSAHVTAAPSPYPPAATLTLALCPNPNPNPNLNPNPSPKPNPRGPRAGRVRGGRQPPLAAHLPGRGAGRPPLHFVCPQEPRSEPSRNLPTGEPLSISYVVSYQPTADRRAQLLSQHGFRCACHRCEQAPELVRCFVCHSCGEAPSSPVASDEGGRSRSQHPPALPAARLADASLMPASRMPLAGLLRLRRHHLARRRVVGRAARRRAIERLGRVHAPPPPVPPQDGGGVPQQHRPAQPPARAALPARQPLPAASRPRPHRRRAARRGLLPVRRRADPPLRRRPHTVLTRTKSCPATPRAARRRASLLLPSPPGNPLDPLAAADLERAAVCYRAAGDAPSAARLFCSAEEGFVAHFGRRSSTDEGRGWDATATHPRCVPPRRWLARGGALPEGAVRAAGCARAVSRGRAATGRGRARALIMMNDGSTRSDAAPPWWADGAARRGEPGRRPVSLSRVLGCALCC